MTLRILWASDAPDATSGYSVETALTVRALRPYADIALLATFGHHGAVRAWDGFPVYPGGADAFANDVIAHSAHDWRADIVITLKDTHVFNPQAFQGVRWLPMTPVDHEPTPPLIVERLRTCYRPIAYAPNGFRQLRAAGLDPLYAPHAFDASAYFPQDQAEARAYLNFDRINLPPNAFIVGTVAVNRGGTPSRKAWPQNLEAFAIFARKHPNARYYVHTDLCPDGFEQGVNIQKLCAQLGILDKIIYSDQIKYRRGGFSPEFMRAMYNAFDVLNAVSRGEGFGIPQLEAQACGVPIIASEFAAARDLCWGGWFVKDQRGRRIRDYDGQEAWTFNPDPEAIADALEQAHTAMTHRSMAAEKRKQALAGAAPYEIQRVVTEHWLPLLQEVERDIRAPRSRGVMRIITPQEVLG